MTTRARQLLGAENSCEKQEMNMFRIYWNTPRATLLAGVLTTFIIGGVARLAYADAVTDWNAIASQATGTAIAAGRPGPATLLDLAIVHVAIHDAVQAFEKRFEPYHVFWRPSYLATLGNAYRVTRQYDKAIEVFQESLHVDPRGGAFLGLVATYSESGHAELARALAGELQQKAPQFSLDLFKRFSFVYRDPAEFERYLTALRKAGLK